MDDALRSNCRRSNSRERREWDSNPRYPFGVHTISSRARSTTPAPLQLIQPPCGSRHSLSRVAAILRWASSARQSRTSSRSCSRPPLSRAVPQGANASGRTGSVLARRSSDVERVATNEGNGEGGIRTHGAFLGHTRFRVVRLQPDSATSPGRGPLTPGRPPRNRKRQRAPPDAGVRLPGRRRAAKNSRSRRALSSASTPLSTATAWFSAGTAVRSITLPAAPPFGSAAP